jgi:hypothetical protein
MILNSPTISGSLTVTGNIIASGSITLSGSVASASYAATASFVALAQTASFVLTAQTASFVANAQTASFVALAQSASNAVSSATASFANAFTVAGTLTAQTLVVQTITSSVDFVTGSTRFGSILGNTHVFSGSVTMNPGGLFVSGSGNVGIGTNSPSSPLEIYASANSKLILNATLNTGSYQNQIDFKNAGTSSAFIQAGKSPTNIDIGLVFGTTVEVMRITSAETTFNYNPQSGSLLSGYNYLNFGGGSIMYRNMTDIYIGSNAKYGSAGTTVACYTSANGMGMLTMDGGTLNYQSATGSVTANTAYGMPIRMTITSAGNIGMGTSSPTAKLTVVKPTRSSTLGASSVLQIVDASAAGQAVGDRAEINFYTNSDSLPGNLQHATVGIIKTSTSGNETADLYFATSTLGGSPVERLRITSGGNIGLGTTTPDQKLTIQAAGTTNALIAFRDSGGTNQNFIGQGNAANDIIFGSSTNDLCFRTQGGNFLFALSNIEFGRLTAGGNLLLGLTSDTGAKINAKNASSGTPVISAINNSAANSRCYYGQKYSGSTDDYYMIFDNVVANKFLFYGNGGLGNVQANNGNISDIRTKKDIIPLESYWNKFKDIEIVKFKYIDQDHDDYNIGLIAQQLEEVAPEFVDGDSWGKDTPAETEEPLKSVYTTDLYHAAIKVLQEAMAKIETLEAQNDALQSRIETLESK